MYKVTLVDKNNQFEYIEVDSILLNDNNIKLKVNDSIYNNLDDILTLKPVDKVIIEII